MLAVLESLQEKFGGRLRALETPSAGEVCAEIDAADIPAVTEFLLASHAARLVLVFAEPLAGRLGASGAGALLDDNRQHGQSGVAEEPLAASGARFQIDYVFEQAGDPVYLILCAPIPAGDLTFPSLAATLPAVNWQEREIQDWFGLVAVGHPNPRRVALHDNWPDVHPLRKDFPLDCVLPPFEGEQHEYRPTLGEGVFQIPVGPVHAGIIEPGHFNFAVAGEPILYLQLRMFYTHKGTEKLFEHLPIGRAVFLAESISGDSSFSHGVAFCQAIELAAEIEVPARAHFGRTVLLELERICNHVADIGAIATDVGFVVANAHAGRLREMVVSLSEELSGSRLLRGMVCVGGLRRDWDQKQVATIPNAMRAVEREFRDLVALVKSSDSTRDRLERTGFLHPDKAKALGIVGVGGRASGVDLDVRRDHPYAAYGQVSFRVPVYQEGDVLHRMQVRIDEVRESLAIIHQAMAQLPGGPICAPAQEIPPGRCALSAVEGWRGEIIHWVRTAPGNRLERCKIKDPSLNNWPALVEAVAGNIIADFPVINKSFNLSYSGTDR